MENTIIYEEDLYREYGLTAKYVQTCAGSLEM